MTIVLAPLAFVHNTDGGDPLELEEGATVPSSADPEHVELLTSQGVLGDSPAETPLAGPSRKTRTSDDG